MEKNQHTRGSWKISKYGVKKNITRRQNNPIKNGLMLVVFASTLKYECGIYD